MIGPVIQPRGAFLTFSTGFSTSFLGKIRSFPGGFPLFPPGFQHQNFPLVIRQVKPTVKIGIFRQQKSLFWPFRESFGGENFLFSVLSAVRAKISPIWNIRLPNFPQSRKGSFPACGKHGFSTMGRRCLLTGGAFAIIILFRAKSACSRRNRHCINEVNPCWN